MQNPTTRPRSTEGWRCSSSPSQDSTRESKASCANSVTTWEQHDPPPFIVIVVKQCSCLCWIMRDGSGHQKYCVLELTDGIVGGSSKVTQPDRVLLSCMATVSSGLVVDAAAPAPTL